MIDKIKQFFQWIGSVIVDAIQAVIDWFLGAFQVIWDGVREYWTQFAAWVTGQLSNLWDGAWAGIQTWWDVIYDLAESIITTLYGWIRDFLEANGVDMASFESQVQTAGDELVNIYEGAAWLLPINACLAIYATTFGTVIFLRSIRWIVSGLHWNTG